MLQTDGHTAINLLESLLISHNLYKEILYTAKEILFPVFLMVIGYNAILAITTEYSTQLIYTDLQIQAQVKYTLLDTL